ncbi:AAA family ATPase [Selenomonas sp. KH1T6]|uniref:AAA family ATPase n=1 Tax=Selenomonas sp. KH1T6 TaxID=3158784 RepID=UPI0008A7D2F2|nr:Sel1 repeat-containing protein [Selenomonas ruminantium]
MGYLDKFAGFLENTFNSNPSNNNKFDRTGEEEFLEGRITNAVSKFQQKYKKGDKRSAYFLGIIYEKGYGTIKRDITEAKKYFHNGADLGDILCLAHLYALGENIQFNIDSIISSVKSLADNGNIFAMNEMAIVSKNDDSYLWNVRAAESGYWKAMHDLAIYFWKKGNYNSAFQYASMAVDKKCIVAYRLLGECYASGKGIEKNIEKAVGLLIGYNSVKPNVKVQARIGELYYSIGEKNKAFKWFKQSFEGGNDDVAFYVGEGYLYGMGDECDYEKGMQLLKNAADNNNGEACQLLGIQYLIANQKEKGWNYVEKAANLGAINACFNIGNRYLNGIDKCEKDVEKAIYWLEKVVNSDEVPPNAKLKLGLAYVDKDNDIKRIDDAKKFLNETRILYMNKDETLDLESWERLKNRIDELEPNSMQGDRKISKLFYQGERKVSVNDSEINSHIELFKEVKNLLDAVEEKIRADERFKVNFHFRNLLGLNITEYLMFLADADGEISWDECYILGKCIDVSSASPESVKGHLNKLSSPEEYFSKIPDVIPFAIALDNVLDEMGLNMSPKFTELIYNLYNDMGYLLTKVDGDISRKEFIIHSKYIQMIKTYIEKERKNDSISSYNLKIEEKKINIKKDVNHIVNEGEEELDELVKQLNSLIGLSGVKEEVKTLINLINNKKRREKMGLKSKPMSMHLVFTGNPGTGKTTVARLLGKIYHHLGILSKGHFVETQRSGLIGGYVGQTAIKVQEVIANALGGILFIDEAYSLAGKGDNDYGTEAIDTLLKEMEDHRDDLVVIVAGYPQEMNTFLESNPGLPSRFNKIIHFVDYTPKELTEIFLYQCHQEDYHIDKSTTEYIINLFTQQYNNRDKYFGNGRFVRNFYEKVLACQVNRLEELGDAATKDELQHISLADVREVEIEDVH